MAIASIALSFGLALIDPLLPEVAELPLPARAVFIALPVVIFLGWWVARVGIVELRIAKGRLEQYGQLYDAYLEQRERVGAGQERLQEVNHLLTAALIFPNRLRSFSFPMIEAMIEGSEVLLELGPMDGATIAATVSPKVGSLLIVIDPMDGVRLAELEVVARRSPHGRRLVRILSGDAVFLGHVRQRAESRESLQMRARAVYIVELVEEALSDE